MPTQQPRPRHHFIFFHIWVPPSAAAKDYRVFLPADLSYFHSLVFSFRVFIALRNWNQDFLFPVWFGSVRQTVHSLLMGRTKKPSCSAVVIVPLAGLDPHKHVLPRLMLHFSTCCCCMLSFKAAFLLLLLHG